MGIPQITAIMGMCVAGGAYLPVMCDHILMTEGSGLFLAGPALVQAAIGQKTSAEDLGGAKMHAQISGTVDFREPDDDACIARMRALVDKMGHPPGGALRSQAARAARVYPPRKSTASFRAMRSKQYDMREIIARIVDGEPLRGIPRRIRPDAAVRLRAHRRLGRRNRRQPEEKRDHRRARHRREAASNSAA